MDPRPSANADASGAPRAPRRQRGAPTGAPELSHLSEHGSARMVDVSEKSVTRRAATATARVGMSTQLLDRLWAGELPKGEALATARIAGIAAAKRTADLIPLCHTLALEWADVTFARENDALLITASARTSARTGVEMEAMCAASVAALTVYDMVKGVDKSITIGPVRLEAKSGGKSGTFRRDDG